MSPSRPGLPLASLVPRRRGRIMGVALLGLIFGLSSCDEHSQQPAQRETSPEAPKVETKPSPVAPAVPTATNAPAPATGVAGAGGAPSTGPAPSIPSFEEELKPIEHSGQYFVATNSSAGIYPTTGVSRREKIGYLRRGGRAPVVVDSKPVKTDECPRGWYALIGGGYVCGEDGTTNLDLQAVKLGPEPPVLTDILPYRYARNAGNGTPLYKTVPTQEQMLRYEPYLKDKDKEKAAKPGEAAPPPVKDMAVKDVDGGAPSGPPKSWWQREDVDDNLSKLKHDDLIQDADDIIAGRMVKGFYVAIDKIFNWNGRTWYKTTKGLIVPADRMWMTDASDFTGTDLGTDHHLPVGWVYGFHKERPKYQIDPETKKLTQDGTVKHFQVVDLTGDTLKIGKTTYVAASEGFWMKQEDLRITEPRELPKDLQPDERWVDVDISSQTLIAYVGSSPVFATMVSSGKESPIKEKDHATPRGEWRIREKHIATTMDGDGTAAGDLPYSIEDVPYVMYFFKAFALHGAFWHRNYGVRMSHGCVNLAPLDAKRLFFFLGPAAPQGWHGIWARENSPGSRVVVHD